MYVVHVFMHSLMSPICGLQVSIHGRLRTQSDSGPAVLLSRVCKCIHVVYSERRAVLSCSTLHILDHRRIPCLARDLCLSKLKKLHVLPSSMQARCKAALRACARWHIQCWHDQTMEVMT